MNDYYLRAVDKAELESALEDSGMVSEFGIIAPDGDSIHVIGTIYRETGNTLTDSEGMECPEQEAIPGYHANYRGRSLPTELERFEIMTPDSPAVVWAS